LEDVDWICLAQDMDWWRASVKTVNLWFRKRREIFKNDTNLKGLIFCVPLFGDSVYKDVSCSGVKGTQYG
jgi:hypothetical protein